jgi:hypothetical protein
MKNGPCFATLSGERLMKLNKIKSEENTMMK